MSNRQIQNKSTLSKITKKKTREIIRDKSFEGRFAVIPLIIKGLGWREIRNHPNAQTYLSFHKQAKMIIIRRLVENKIVDFDEICKDYMQLFSCIVVYLYLYLVFIINTILYHHIMYIILIIHFIKTIYILNNIFNFLPKFGISFCKFNW
jgi:hypothetical protein